RTGPSPGTPPSDPDGGVPGDGPVRDGSVRGADAAGAGGVPADSTAHAWLPPWSARLGRLLSMPVVAW
ncbi:MAG TPA: hypothetical protein PK929_05530, partial [Quisquiliibacterium sp.]|nr:hypothetical protein [Quisquiliibacterium sp.]